jgi:hypothetical protein
VKLDGGVESATQVRHHDRCPFAGERQRTATPDIALPPAAGDERYLALELAHVAWLSCDPLLRNARDVPSLGPSARSTADCMRQSDSADTRPAAGHLAIVARALCEHRGGRARRRRRRRSAAIGSSVSIPEFRIAALIDPQALDV